METTLRRMRTGGHLFNITAGLILLSSVSLALALQDPFLTLDAPVCTNGQFQFRLTGENNVTYVVERSDDLQNWTPIFTNSDSASVRLLTTNALDGAAFYRVQRGLVPWFRGAITAKSNIVLNGNSVYVDSFDSQNPVRSTNGAYYYPWRKCGGDLASGNGDVDLGNAVVKGKVFIGPAGFILIGPVGSVGDLNWSGPGIQPGWFMTDYRFCLSDVDVPYTTGLSPGGNATNKYVLGNGQYIMTSLTLSSHETMLVTGDALLYVTGNISMSTFAAAINIASGARLRLIVGGPFASLSTVNTTGTAFSFQYYGLPSNTSVSWYGNGLYVGILYAPEATLTLGGGGSNNSDFQGACVVNSCIISGKFNIHFDEALLYTGPMR